MDYQTACRILKITDGHDERQVKHAFAELSREVHPEEDPEGFQLIHEAFSFLNKELRRKKQRTGQNTSIPEEIEEEPVFAGRQTYSIRMKVEESEVVSEEEQEEEERISAQQEEHNEHVNDAIADAYQKYNGMIDQLKYNSRMCMSGIFHKYSYEVYSDKKYADFLAKLVVEPFMDSTFADMIDEYYVFGESCKKPSLQKLFDVVTTRTSRYMRKDSIFLFFVVFFGVFFGYLLRGDTLGLDMKSQPAYFGGIVITFCVLRILTFVFKRKYYEDLVYGIKNIFMIAVMMTLLLTGLTKSFIKNIPGWVLYFFILTMYFIFAIVRGRILFNRIRFIKYLRNTPEYKAEHEL